MVTKQEYRKGMRILAENRKCGGAEPNTWDYEDRDELPDSLQDNIGVSIIQYILNEDEQFTSSKQISRELEVEASPSKIGSRIRIIGRTLGIDDSETDYFYSSNTTWDLDVLQDNGLDELYNDIQA